MNTTEETKAPSLESLMDTELRATGQDIPEGSYAGTLFNFSEPFFVPTSEKFRKPGDPDKRLVFDARFGMFDKTGELTEMTYLLPVPDGGMANRKSNLYKMLKALAAGSPELINAEGNIAKGTKLSSFLGRTGVLTVGKNDKDWPKVTGVSPRMDGLKYPDLQTCRDTLKGSKDVPF